MVLIWDRIMEPQVDERSYAADEGRSELPGSASWPWTDVRAVIHPHGKRAIIPPRSPSRTAFSKIPSRHRSAPQACTNRSAGIGPNMRSSRCRWRVSAATSEHRSVHGSVRWAGFAGHPSNRAFDASGITSYNRKELQSPPPRAPPGTRRHSGRKPTTGSSLTSCSRAAVEPS